MNPNLERSGDDSAPLRWCSCALIALALAVVSGCRERKAAEPQATTSQGAADSSTTEGQATVLLIEVHDLTGLSGPDSPLHLASNANGWDPASVAHRGELVDTLAAGTRAWRFSVPRSTLEGLPDERLEFKFTRGSWDVVEVGFQGADVANRTLSRVNWRDSSSDRPFVIRVNDVQNFADLRPATTPSASAESSVTGSVEIFTVDGGELGSSRTVRVWLPEGYAENPDRRYPVLYMHDGQNLFDRLSSAFGMEWRADEAATDLIGRGEIPAMLIVGIDNAGARRSWEYLPIAPGAVRPDMEGGGALKYLDFVTGVVMPRINERYRTLTGPENTSLGGSSFGGVITLTAMMERPGVFGTLLIESPSLWVGDGAFMAMVEGWSGRAKTDPALLPRRVFVAQGDAEHGDAARDAALVARTRELEALLTRAGLGSDRLRVVIEPGAKHNEEAWAKRLPGAMEFLFGDGG